MASLSVSSPFLLLPKRPSLRALKCQALASDAGNNPTCEEGGVRYKREWEEMWRAYQTSPTSPSSGLRSSRSPILSICDV